MQVLGEVPEHLQSTAKVPLSKVPNAYLGPGDELVTNPEADPPPCDSQMD